MLKNGERTYFPLTVSATRIFFAYLNKEEQERISSPLEENSTTVEKDADV